MEIWYSHENDCFMAVSTHYNCVGDGETKQEAIENLKISVNVFKERFRLNYNFQIPKFENFEDKTKAIVNIFISLTGLTYSECLELIETTDVYKELQTDEIRIHQGIFINILDICVELRKAKKLHITDDSVVLLFNTLF